MSETALIFLDISGPGDNDTLTFDLLENICETEFSGQIFIDDMGWRMQRDKRGREDQNAPNGACTGIVKISRDEIERFFRVCREKGYTFNEKARFYGSSIEVDLSFKDEGDEMYF